MIIFSSQVASQLVTFVDWMRPWRTWWWWLIAGILDQKLLHPSILCTNLCSMSRTWQHSTQLSYHQNSSNFFPHFLLHIRFSLSALSIFQNMPSLRIADAAPWRINLFFCLLGIFHNPLWKHGNHENRNTILVLKILPLPCDILHFFNSLDL